MRVKGWIWLAMIGVVAVILIVAYNVWTPWALVKSDDRQITYSPDQELRTMIASETKNMTGEEILEYSIKKTANSLTFTAENDVTHGKANCVGYAQMCAGISNYAFQVNGLDSKAKPVVGFVMFYQVNLCDVLKGCMPNKRWENFVKDHDFVEYHINGSIIYADASLYDLIGTDCKTSPM